MIKKILIGVLTYIGISNIVYAQDRDVINTDAIRNNIEKTALWKTDPQSVFKSIRTDLLIHTYQALIKNGILKQDDNEVQLKSTIYGLIKIFDSSKAEDRTYTKLRWARNIQVGVGAVLGDENKITDFNSSLTIALINKRQPAGNFALFSDSTFQAKTMTALDLIFNTAFKKVETLFNDNTISTEKKNAALKKLEDFSETFNYALLADLMTATELADFKAQWEGLVKEYTDAQRQLSGGALLTYGYEGNYGSNKWSKIDQKLEFVVGLGHKTDSVRKYDFYAGTFYNFSQDTLNKSQALNRRVFSAKAGINSVLIRSREDGGSIVEAFGGLEYKNISKGIYTGEKESTLNVDVTVSFRITKNVYLPIQIKYDPSIGRFNGFVDLKFDIIKLF